MHARGSMTWALSRAAALGVVCLFVAYICCLPAYAGGGPKNVCVVQNGRSEISRNVCRYYVRARNIPPENVCTIICPTDETIPYDLPDSEDDCVDSIILPLRQFLQNPEISGRIDYIVLCKGVPLRADSGLSTGPLSVSDILTCLDFWSPSTEPGIYNPYGPTLFGGSREEYFSHQKSFGGYHLYLVTRLDGYTEGDICTMIDRGINASPFGPIALDGYPYTSGDYASANQKIVNAYNSLNSRGISTIYDNTATFLGSMTGIMGYYSWGSNDPTYKTNPWHYLDVFRSNIFSAGAIADTYVSVSARTFSPEQSYTTLVADLISQGACGVNGYVSEPYISTASDPNILFDRYTKGFNLAESFYMALPRLMWKSTVVGDPIMQPYATRPIVLYTLPSAPLTGVAELTTGAVDPAGYGIAKVEFYWDGKLIGTDTTAPYTATIDTRQYPVGLHDVEMIAYQNSNLYTQGFESAAVWVENEVSKLFTLSDAFPSPDGQGVDATDLIVTAGTVEMGGGEFYVQEADRSCGIRVESNVVVDEGQVVNLLGYLSTESGERTIVATQVDITGSVSSLPKPFYIPGKFIGGGAIGPETRGITGGKGARNLGLLVRTCGEVTYIGNESEEFFYIDDGSNLRDGSGYVGLRIAVHGLEKPPLGSKVIVTGISACDVLGDAVIPMLKVRRSSDIILVVM